MLPIGTTYGGGYYVVASLAIIFGSLWAIYVLMSRSIRAQNLRRERWRCGRADARQ